MKHPVVPPVVLIIGAWNYPIHLTLASYLGDGGIVCGGQVDRGERDIELIIIKNLSPSAPVMQAEIFGLILPVLAVKNMDEAVAFVNGRDKPLAFYIFSEDLAALKTSSHAPIPAGCASTKPITTWPSQTRRLAGWVRIGWVNITANGVSATSPTRARYSTTRPASTPPCATGPMTR